jgi:hypothetical protein
VPSSRRILQIAPLETNSTVDDNAPQAAPEE